MSESKNILIVDDNRENIDILLGLLDSYDPLVALNGEKAISLALRNYLDLILLDILMPGINGIEVCRKLKENIKTKNIPIIFITAKTDEDTIEEAFEAGGVDFVTKPFKPRELLSRVKTHLEMQELIQNLEFLSYYDQLTGIFNRRKFFEVGENMFMTQPESLYAFMMDIDKFKRINDTYGHPTGDIVIRKVSKVMTDVLKDKALLGRIGGEEFAVLISAGDDEKAFEVIEKIRRGVEQLSIQSDKGDLLKVTISGGVGKYDDSMANLDMLLHKADEALYDSKNQGRNRSIFRV